MSRGEKTPVGEKSSHTNSLIPLYAQGVGAHSFSNMVVGVDGNLVAGYGLRDASFDGSYVDNTSVYQAMVDAVAIPEPAALLLTAAASLGLLLCRTSRPRKTCT